MEPLPDYTQKETDSPITANYPNRTSFLIEDILYRQKTEELQNSDKMYERRAEIHPAMFKPAPMPSQMKFENEKMFPQPKPMEKRAEKAPYGYFQPTGIQGGGGGGVVAGSGGLNHCVQGFQPTENGYIQVMGALGAYLGTPYKTISDPYFLTQGKNIHSFIHS